MRPFVSASLLLSCLPAAHSGTEGLPNPFAPNNSEAFSFVGRIGQTMLQRSLEKRAARAAQVEPGNGIHTLGVAWNSLGVSFPEGWDFSAPAMQQVLRPYYLETGDRVQQQTTRCMLNYDFCAASRSNRAGSFECSFRASDDVQRKDKPLLASLQRSGFALLDSNWRFGDILRRNGSRIKKDVTDALDAQEARSIRNRASTSSQVVYVIEDLPSMASLTKALLFKLGPTVQAYMGEDVELTNFNLMRIPAKSQGKFTSAGWHHDRCGKRLKVFIFVGRVDETTHSTEIAAGSHRTLYYSYSWFHESRVNARFVEEGYNRVRMSGEEGDGFIFDTNTLHRAHVNEHARERRDAIVFEFNHIGKMQTLGNITGIPENQAGFRRCIPSGGASVRRRLSQVPRAHESSKSSAELFSLNSSK